MYNKYANKSQKIVGKKKKLFLTKSCTNNWLNVFTNEDINKINERTNEREREREERERTERE